MWLWIAGGVIGSIGLTFFWGIRSLRRNSEQAQQEILKLTLADVGRLADECRTVFREKLCVDLKLENFEESAKLLSHHVDDLSLKKALSKDDFWWYFVLPVGALLGELLRVHAGAEWKPSAEGGLEMEIPVKGGGATTYPFEKILKQATVGDKGDLYAYLKAAVQIESIAVAQGTGA